MVAIIINNLVLCMSLSLLWMGRLSCAFRTPIQQRMSNFPHAASRRKDDIGSDSIPFQQAAYHKRADGAEDRGSRPISRSHVFEQSSKVIVAGLSLIVPAEVTYAKCTDIETCREEGERKIEADLKLNPIIKLSDGVRYRVLQTSALSGAKVKDGSSIDLIYSISTASGLWAVHVLKRLWLRKSVLWREARVGFRSG